MLVMQGPGDPQRKKSGSSKSKQIDWKIVQIIVDKLGYAPEEVERFVIHDSNSFVGVLYQKLLDD
jgi:hypothetical protein